MTIVSDVAEPRSDKPIAHPLISIAAAPAMRAAARRRTESLSLAGTVTRPAQDSELTCPRPVAALSTG